MATEKVEYKKVFFITEAPKPATDPEEFKRFHEKLTEGRPNYNPFYFPLTKGQVTIVNGRDRETKELVRKAVIGGKDPKVMGSWKNAKLTFEQAYKRLQNGFNVGIAATDEDKLSILDVDDMEAVGEFKNSLTCASRKRIGRHAYYFTEDPINEDGDIFTDTAKQNIATEDYGELRANWQYVVAPGSYVPVGFHEFMEIPVHDRVNAGKYSIIEYTEPSDITFEELPEVYKNEIYKDRTNATNAKIRKDDRIIKKNIRHDVNKSALWELDLDDVIGVPSVKNSDRFASLFHGSDTGKNTAVKDGLLHCWRHNVSHNGLTALAVLSGVAGCKDAGYGHKHSSTTCIDFTDGETILTMWEYAKEHGILPKDDPIPTSALIHYAIENEICIESEIKDGWKLPTKKYNQTLQSFLNNGVEPGRSQIKEQVKPQATLETGNNNKKSIAEVREALENIESIPVDELEKNTAVKDFILSNCKGWDRSDIEAFANGHIKEKFKYTAQTKFDKVIADAWKPVKINNNLAKEQAKEQAKKEEEEEEKKEQVYPNEVANRIIEEMDLIVLRDTQTFNIYKDGIYEDIGGISNASQLRKHVRNTYHDMFIEKNPHVADMDDFEYFASDKSVREALSYIQDTIWIDREEMDKKYCEIVVKNGILNLETGELKPHSPKEYHTVKIDVTYDPEVSISPEFENYLKSTFKGVEWEIDVVQEMFGYCLYRKYTHEYFFLNYGTGEDGKTALMNTLRALLGNENVSSTSLHDISHPRNDYALYGLYRKMANICGEIGKGAIRDTSNLKIATGRETIRTRDLRQSFIEFNNYAKLIFAMNHPPEFDDFSEGLKRRIVLIEYPNKFKKGAKGTINSIEDTFTTPESMTGILNWAIEGLRRLLKNGIISHSRTNAENGINYDKKSRPVVYFVRECIDIDANDRITKAELHQAYVEYAQRNNAVIHTDREFTQLFENTCEEEGINLGKVIRIGSKTGYRGIKTKECVEMVQDKLVSGDEKDTAQLNIDLVNFLNSEYPNGVIDNAGAAGYNFGKKYHGYVEEHGYDYIIKLAEKHSQRGFIN